MAKKDEAAKAEAQDKTAELAAVNALAAAGFHGAQIEALMALVKATK